MTQSNLTTWLGEKNKAPHEKLAAVTAVGASVNINCRKKLSAMHSILFFGKTMKSYGLLLLPLLLLTGCLATPIKPSVNKMSAIRTVLVVPVESPPLEVIPDLIETRYPVYRQYHYQAMPYQRFMEEKIYRSPGGVLIAGLVSDDDSVPAAELQQSSGSNEKTAGLEPIASLSENWTPNITVAQEAVSQLSRDGIKAMLSEHYYRLPIADGDRDANLGNWRDAVEQWYSQNQSSIDYRQPGLEDIDAVIEVGIGTYRIFDAQTSLQVLIKLIDPKTRQVIGRISEKAYSAEDSPQTLLQPEAEKFKQLMSNMGGQLVSRGFSGLGLALKVSGQYIEP